VSGRARWRRRLPVLGLALVAACSATSRQRDVAVLPTGDGNLLRFDAKEVAVLDAKAAKGQTFPVRATGSPRASALELSERLAAVAYADALAITDLSGVAEPTWLPLPATLPARALAIRQGRCAIVGDNRDAMVLQLPSGDVVWRGRAGVRVDEVYLVVPTQSTEQLIVARRGETVLVQRLDLARGEGELTGETIVPRLNVVGAAATAGGSIFVAGLREESTASMRGALRQWLVIVRIDPNDFRVEELVYERMDAIEGYVTDLAVGQEMVAITLWLYGKGTRLRVYDQVKNRKPANWSFDQGIDQGSAVAWLSPDFVAVVPVARPPQILQVVAER
jgi:hypothetical protein